MAAIAAPQPSIRRTRALRECLHRPRVQFNGTLRLLCPQCGHVRDYQLRPGTWKLTCKNAECARVFVLGYRVLIPRQVRGGDQMPEDYVFPVGSLDYWEPGEPVIEVRRK